MQGRARARKGERKTHHITSYHHITMEFGGYLLNVARNPTCARARKEAQGVLSYQKVTGIFDNPHITNSIKEGYRGPSVSLKRYSRKGISLPQAFPSRNWGGISFQSQFFLKTSPFFFYKKTI